MGKKIPKMIVDQSFEVLEKLLKEYDQQLEGKTFLIGDHLTIADFNLYTVYLAAEYLCQYKFSEKLPHFHKYISGLKDIYPLFKEDETSFYEALSKL